MRDAYFLLDTNVYRNLTKGLNSNDILPKSIELSEKENLKNSQALCSVIVAVELISHLEEGDPEKEECYKALCLLNHHTYNHNIHSNRLIAFPFENVLSNFFINKNFKHYDNYLHIIKLVELLTNDAKIENCILYHDYILDIKQNQYSFRQKLILQAESSLDLLGWDWQIFTASSLRKNKQIKDINTERLNTFNKGIVFYQIAKNLIDNIYEDELIHKTPDKLILKIYLEKFQAPLQLYHYLVMKIGEAPNMQSVLDDRWNTINDMHLLFNVCDTHFNHTLFVTEETLLIDIMILNSMGDRVGKINDYTNIIK